MAYLVYERWMFHVPWYVIVLIHQMSPEISVCGFLKEVVKDDLHYTFEESDTSSMFV
jgi:hypothetical protein